MHVPPIFPFKDILELAAISNDHRSTSLSILGPNRLNLPDDIHPVRDRAEDYVLSIQPWSINGAKKELRTVGSWTRISHRKNARASMLEDKILILKLVSVDTLASSTVAKHS
jgi:hypothetical protein